MSEYESFANPPVEEAIITMRLRPLDDPEAVATRLFAAERKFYPSCEVIDPELDPSASAGEAVDGVAYRLPSPNGREVIRITERAFSFHRLRPYSGWDQFIRGARLAWRAFVRAASTDRVLSVELRYLNRFAIPEGVEEWNEYLRIYPALPRSLDRGLQNFMVSLNLVELGIPGEGTVTLVTLPRHDGTIPVILDVDVRASAAFAAAEDEDAMWRTLERLRAYKNQVFFDGLTERAKGLFR